MIPRPIKKREVFLSFFSYTETVNKNTIQSRKGGLTMKLFRKKANVILRSEQQKEEFVEKLENAHIRYNIRVDQDNASGYVIRLYADDLKKVE